MKKSYFFLCLSLLAIAACTPKNQFTISGSVEGDCDSVYFTGDRSDLITVAVPVVDGHYQWEGVVDSVINIWVCKDSDHSSYCRAILEPGDIVVNIPAEGLGSQRPSGTPLNDSIAAFLQMKEEWDERLNRVHSQMANATDDSLKALNAKYSATYAEYCEHVASSLAGNTDNAFGVYLLRSLQFFSKPELVEASVQKLHERFPGNFWTERISKKIEGAIRASVGRKYTDLTMPTPEGEEMSLSDIIPHNKYTFIDFWASWCGPCRAELPNVKAAYDKYHAEGLEVVGVSFDGDAEAWKECIAEESLLWPQMSDLKGWGCAAAGVYGIQGIPFTMLVAQDGIIVANNLRGKALMQKLDELMGSKP